MSIALLLLAASAAAQNELPQTIIYPDDGTQLKAVFSGIFNDLAPDGEYQKGVTADGWSSSLNDNVITVNSGTMDNIFGAFYRITEVTPPEPFPSEVAGNQIIDLFHNPETPPVTGENFPVFCQKWEKPSCLMCILKVMEHI